MRTLDLRVRYFQDSTPVEVPCREENFIRREITMPLPIEQTAFVLVDVWNVHFIESWIERAKDVTVNEIVPALNAAREAGIDNCTCPLPGGCRDNSLNLNRHTPPEIQCLCPIGPRRSFGTGLANTLPIGDRAVSLRVLASIGIAFQTNWGCPRQSKYKTRTS